MTTPPTPQGARQRFRTGHHSLDQAARDDLPKRLCLLCGGCGKVSDDRETGGALKKHREASGVTLREVGRRLGFSAAYISDLEHGRRAWNAEKVSNFLKACRSSNEKFGKQ